MVGLSERYLSDPDMVAAQIVEQEYLQALGKYSVFFCRAISFCLFNQLKTILQRPKISHKLHLLIIYYKTVSKIYFSNLLWQNSSFIKKVDNTKHAVD